MRKNQDIIAAVQAADEIRAIARTVVCGECEGVCYTVEVKALGTIARQEWKTWIGKREHLDLVEALDAVVRMAASVSAKVKARDARRWIMEHQPSIW